MKKRVSFIILFICLAFSAMADVNKYEFNNMFTISVSDILELRKDDDAYTRFLSDTLNYVANSEIVFQQKELSERSQSALAKYCRIMIKTDIDESCPYPCSDEDDFTSDDFQELVSACQAELAPGKHFICQPTASVKSTSNGSKYINIYYTRSGSKGEVRVNICYFFNYKYAVKAIFSYRTSESNIWESAIRNSIDSFSWTDPYTSQVYLSENNTGAYSSSLESNSSNQILYGIMIGIVFMLVLGCGIYFIVSSKKASTRKSIENELIKVNTLIAERKIVSAHKAITALKVSHGQILNDFRLAINDSENKIQLVKNEAELHINNLIAEVKDNLLNKGGNSIETSSVKKINDNQEIPLSLKDKLNEGLSSIEKEYQHGIIPNQQECYTRYELPVCDARGVYSFYTAPKNGTIVFPYRRRKVELRGFTEKGFEDKLRNSFSNNKNYQVLGDVSILTAEGYHPYEPDISIIEVNDRFGIRIDVEIDEPYSGLEKTTIHYIGCGDEFRDKNLANHGWIVIRFSEKQIHNEPSKCINYIRYILSLIDNDIISIHDFPTADKRWTEIEAQIMSVKDFRENLLHHKFGKMEKDSFHQLLPQTKEEKAAAIHVAPLQIPSTQQYNIDNSSQSFEQDSKLSFEPNEHIYLYNGERNLTPVSTIVNHFFEPFDSIGLSERVAYRDGKDQCEVLEEWDSKGLESREIGTFLHSQIEMFFSGKPIVNHTRFTYSGEYVNIDKVVSIKDEIDYFKNFLKENPITPFRTEWHICDLELGIAGTVDLLCRNGNDFDMFDWKRSRKASPEETVWRYGINGLNHIPDISYYHYAIQQNLYRYILEKNYGITIKNMSIVVFHPIYNDYRQYEIPRLDKEIKIIINHLSSTNKNHHYGRRITNKS